MSTISITSRQLHAQAAKARRELMTQLVSQGIEGVSRFLRRLSRARLHVQWNDEARWFAQRLKGSQLLTSIPRRFTQHAAAKSAFCTSTH